MAASISVPAPDFIPCMPLSARFDIWECDESEPASFEKFRQDVEETFFEWSEDIIYHRENLEHDIEYKKLQAQWSEVDAIAKAHIEKAQREMTDLIITTGSTNGMAERRRLLILQLAMESEKNTYEQGFLRAQFRWNIEELQRESITTE